MKDLKHLIYFEDLLQEANNELVAQAQKEGMKCIGYMCENVPEPLLNLPGCFSARLRAPRTGSIDVGTYYLTSFLCEYSRAILERALEGGYNFLDAVITPDGCTMLNRCVENMDVLQAMGKDKKGFFFDYMEIPMKADYNGLNLYVVQCKNHILKPLAENYGIDISDAAIRKAVDQHNKVCELIRAIGDFRKLDNPTITGYEFNVFCLASYVAPKHLIIDKLEETLANLSNMQIFSRLQFTCTPRDTTQMCDTLDVRLDVTMDQPIEAEFDFNITQKSNSQIGPNAAILLSKRNAFGHGETFTLKLKGSYEWLTKGAQVVKGQDQINSYDAGAGVSITYPWLVFPGLNKKRFRYPTSTSFKFDFDHLNRSGYYRLLSFNAEATYAFQTSRSFIHRVTPLSLTYDRLEHTTAKFDSIASQNRALLVSLQDQFIPAMQYTLIYDNNWDIHRRFNTWMEVSVKESSNLIGGVSTLMGWKKFDEKGKKMFSSPYSQFLKLTFDLRNKYKLTDKSLIATRLYAGALWSYGNSSFAPYSELFYVGGANDIRAFAARAIGPGRYYDYQGRGTYLDQAGDLKLEANIEYRFNLVSNLHGALFLDAGNVWMLRRDDGHPSGDFRSGSLLNSIALGTGFGFRYDLEFLVLRLDLGIGLHAPYDTGKSSYYNMPKFWDSLGFHFAVGYPF